MPHETKITVKYENSRPMELTDLSGSLLALSEEYKLRVEVSAEPTGDGEMRLFVANVRPGSIIIELIALSPYALPFPGKSDFILEFADYLKGACAFLLGESDAAPRLVRANYEHFERILEPVVKDQKSALDIATMHVSVEPVTVHIDSVQANAMQNRVRRELETLKQPKTGFHEKVLLYWFQARNDPKATRGDRVIIESIHDGPVKAVFLSDSIKGKILSAAENMFHMAYVVDVAVETIQGRPSLYRILELHDVIERETGNSK